MAEPAATDPWIIRPYDASRDENGVVFLWLKSFAHSAFGRALGAHIDGSDDERAYWAQHKEVVLRLLEHADTRVLCDRDAPDVIWAFATTQEPNVYHYSVVKRRFRGQSEEFFRALLGGFLDKPCLYTHDPAGTGLQVPRSWTYNPYGAAHAQ